MKKFFIRLAVIIVLIFVYFLGRELFKQMEKQSYTPRTVVFDMEFPDNVVEFIKTSAGVNLTILKPEKIENVYVAGFFNNWVPEDKEYKLQKVDKSKWTIKIPVKPGDNQYKFIVYLTDESQPVWTQAKSGLHYDDGFGGYNSIIRVGDAKNIRLIFNVVLLGLIGVLLLVTLLDPLLVWIMHLRLKLSVKLTISVLIVALLSNVFIIGYNIYEQREITKQGFIDEINLIHNVLLGEGVDFANLSNKANIQKLKTAFQKFFWNACPREEKNETSNIQISILSIAIFNTNFNLIYNAQTSYNVPLQNLLMERLNFSNVSVYLRKERYKNGIDQIIKLNKFNQHHFFKIEEKYTFSQEYIKIMNLSGYTALIVPITYNNKLVGYYCANLHVELLGIEIRRIILFNLFFLIITLLLLLILLSNIGRQITSYLKELIDWTVYIVKGNFESEKIINTKDEIEMLAQNFNAMRISLNKNMNNLRLMNYMTASLQTVAPIDNLYKVFLTFLTANFGFQYNRAAIFIKENDVLVGKYAIGMLNEEEIKKHFGSNEDYNKFTIDAETFMESYKENIKQISGKFVERVMKVNIDMFTPSIFWDVCKRSAMLYIAKDYHYMHEFDIAVRSDLNLEDFVLLPLFKGKENIGVLLIDNYFHKTPIKERDINQLQIVLNDFSANLENSYMIENLEHIVEERTVELNTALDNLQEKSRIIKTDLIIAKRIQMNLLPRDIEKITDINFEIKYEPMAEVGGDFYDIIEIDPGCYRILLADATGHGVQAALITMLIKGEYEKIKFAVQSPNELLEVLNNEFIANYRYLSFFFTCIVMDIDINNKKIVYASAGHPNQFYITNTEIRELLPTGKITGILEDVKYRTETIDFKDGDKVLLFTDGLFEQFNPQMEEFTDVRLLETACKQPDIPMKLMIDYLLHEVVTYMDGTEVSDDITIIGMTLGEQK